MKFQIEGVRTKTIVTTMVQKERISGEIDITKKEVMRVTECLAKEDGDPTAWYSYVAQAVEDGADFLDARSTRKNPRKDFKDEDVYFGTTEACDIIRRIK
ncbi:MAG: hypothetical protein CM15mV50_080 [uncultured marine virus]|nr:MAG: hypothetical protein CM15mV50_080 [uncultured marine virus]